MMGEETEAAGWSKPERGGLIWVSATCPPPVAQWGVPRGPEHEVVVAVPRPKTRQVIRYYRAFHFRVARIQQLPDTV